MKKIFNWILILTAAAALQACLGDNYEQPNAGFHGGVYDAETGELAVSEEEGSLMTDELLQETYDLWLAACKAAKNADDLDTLLISLSGLDVKFCVPLLVDVLESTTGEMHNVALEHLDIATNRDGVTNREEAALWLMKEAEE